MKCAFSTAPTKRSLFEPADYGFAEENVLPAGETVRVEAELEVDAALPVRGVRVTAVTPI